MSRRSRRRQEKNPLTVKVGTVDTYVAIQIICKGCSRPLVLVGRDTDPSHAPDIWVRQSNTSKTQFRSDTYAGQDKLSINCSACRGTPQALWSKLEQGLAQLWEPNKHAVVPLPL